MPSAIAWLDASSEEQRRMRDIIRLFTERESRDELGLGQIRDAIADGLFPGTSTLHTRARYLLFVPWAYQLASGRADPAADADRYERQLIAAIKDTDDYAGLLGMQAGIALRTLPSSVYWSMLRRYRILADPTFSQDDALRLHGLDAGLDNADGEAHRFHAWSSTLPAAPAGFPKEVPGGFALTGEEAAWLRDRILDETPGTLLAHLVLESPSRESPLPWADAAAHRVTGDAKLLLDHAQAFSAVVHGAQLLYNLMLAEGYEAAGFEAVSNPVDRYRDELQTWAEELPGQVDPVTWDLPDLLARVELIRSAPVHPRTRRFVQEWIELVRTGDPARLSENQEARRFIADRERRNKGALARVGNRRRLQSWGGSAGAAALGFRWSTVRGILLDIHDGLARGAEVPDA